MGAVNDASNMTGATTGLVSQVYSGENQEKQLRYNDRNAAKIRDNVAEGGDMFEKAFNAFMGSQSSEDKAKYGFAMQMARGYTADSTQTLGGSANMGGGTSIQNYQGSPYGGSQLNQGPQNTWAPPPAQTQQTQQQPFNPIGGAPLFANSGPQSYSVAANGNGFNPNQQQQQQDNQFRSVS